MEDLVCETSISRISAPCMMFGSQLWQGSHGKRQGCRRFVQLMMFFTCLIWPQAPGSTFWKVLNCPCAEAWTWMKILKHQWFKTRKMQPKTYFWYRKMLHSILMPDWLAIANGPGFDDISACLGFGWPSGSGTPAWSEGVIVLENRTLSQSDELRRLYRHWRFSRKWSLRKCH